MEGHKRGDSVQRKGPGAIPKKGLEKKFLLRFAVG